MLVGKVTLVQINNQSVKLPHPRTMRKIALALGVEVSDIDEFKLHKQRAIPLPPASDLLLKLQSQISSIQAAHLGEGEEEWVGAEALNNPKALRVGRGHKSPIGEKKVAVTLYLETELKNQAKAQGINLSWATDQALLRAVQALSPTQSQVGYQDNDQETAAKPEQNSQPETFQTATIAASKGKATQTKRAATSPTTVTIRPELKALVEHYRLNVSALTNQFLEEELALRHKLKEQAYAFRA